MIIVVIFTATITVVTNSKIVASHKDISIHILFFTVRNVLLLNALSELLKQSDVTKQEPN